LVIGEGCVAESLKLLATGEELLADEKMPLFSVTQERPYNNEIKLIYMNKRTTYPANRVRREGDSLIVGFELAPYEAIVDVTVKDKYIAFTLRDFLVKPEDYDYLKMDTPPACEFRLLQLPVKNRENYGKWLNVIWDFSASVGVLATSPHARIDSEKRADYRILTADAVRGIKLRGCSAALVADRTESYLDAVDSLEVDYKLPRGVMSRRDKRINDSIYWTKTITPENADEHIRYAKAGGFKLMLIYYKAIFKSTERGYYYCSDYDYSEKYPNGADDLLSILNKIKAAGITPGLHFLHTHIGMRSRYVTPIADRRLNTTRSFTLARSIGKDDTVIYVDENPEGSVMHEDCRVLKVGGELISYEGYTDEVPYSFFGCKRGYNDTVVLEHREGEIGGILDISEFSASSVYANQNSDIQDEIGDKIAAIYNLGFEFVYFDGSEGTNPPFEFHVPNAQYRVYKKFNTPPIFAEGAAKAHFGWHILSGANAFDAFPTDIFKAMIDKFPVVAAKEMQKDFTRVNFGWWKLYTDTQPDTYEYGMSRAVAWNCPATMMARIESLRQNPRINDVLEVLRRWQDAKEKGIITEKEKSLMRDSSDEYTLIVNSDGEYELLPCFEIKNVAGGAVSAFVFEYLGYRYVSVWHKTGEGRIALPVSAEKISYLTEVAGDEISVDGNEKSVTLQVNSRKYVKTSLSREEITAVLESAVLVD